MKKFDKVKNVRQHYNNFISLFGRALQSCGLKKVEISQIIAPPSLPILFNNVLNNINFIRYMQTLYKLRFYKKHSITC